MNKRYHIFRMSHKHELENDIIMISEQPYDGFLSESDAEQHLEALLKDTLKRHMYSNHSIIPLYSAGVLL